MQIIKIPIKDIESEYIQYCAINKIEGTSYAFEYFMKSKKMIPMYYDTHNQTIAVKHYPKSSIGWVAWRYFIEEIKAQNTIN